MRKHRERVLLMRVLRVPRILPQTEACPRSFWRFHLVPRARKTQPTGSSCFHGTAGQSDFALSSFRSKRRIWWTTWGGLWAVLVFGTAGPRARRTSRLQKQRRANLSPFALYVDSTEYTIKHMTLHCRPIRIGRLRTARLVC